VVEYRIQVTNTSSWLIPIVGWTYAGPPAPPTLPPLFGPVGGGLPPGPTISFDLDATVPLSAPPITVPICLNAEGAVDCYNITINP
jgi:hypothetical protein